MNLEGCVGFLRGRARPALDTLVRVVNTHADHDVGGLRWGVEPTRPGVTERGYPIAPTTYYAALARARIPSARERRDEVLKVSISRVHGENCRVYGARKVWLVLNREGIRVARCTVERPMSELSLVGSWERRVRTCWGGERRWVAGRA